MSVATSTRKPLGVRATPEEHQRIKLAARREHRSVNSFVLSAALEAASGGAQTRGRTPEQIRAAIERAQRLMQPFQQKGRSLSEELTAERRAESARE
jgi:uncharacterized protein (DUF1778 family)